MIRSFARSARLAPVMAAALAVQPAAAQRQVETDAPYAHDPARAVFPLRVGEFRRGDIYRYDALGRDVSASYARMTPEGRLLITVYIYPAPRAAAAARAGRCREEFGSAKAAIARQHANAAPADEGPGFAVAGADPKLAHRARYRLRARFDGATTEIRSELHLYCYVGGDWLVKYRASAPAAVAVGDLVESFIRTGPWPGRGSPATVALAGPGRGRGTPLPAQR